MAAAGESELDKLLSQATGTLNSNLDVDVVNKFVDKVDSELEGHLIAARLLGHKIQSPQERESLFALMITEECANRCGKRFQAEIGKFRFLNEMIKMVSPKYYGSRTSPKVKDKIIKLMYKWSQSMRQETKILEAYEMLKKQGIIDDDPMLEDEPYHPPPRKEQPSLFDDDKAKLLAKLLRSKHAEDLQAANRLIKNMVKQDEEKQEKVSQRFVILETVKNNVRLLREMLDCYNPASTSTPDQDVIKELYQNLERERPKIFKLASETDEKDMETMGKILATNDEVVQVMTAYKSLLGDLSAQKLPKGDVLLDLNVSSSSRKDLDANLADDLAGLDLGGGAAAASGNSSAGALGLPAVSAANDIFADFASASTDSSPAQPQLPLGTPAAVRTDLSAAQASSALSLLGGGLFASAPVTVSPLLHASPFGLTGPTVPTTAVPLQRPQNVSSAGSAAFTGASAGLFSFESEMRTTADDSALLSSISGPLLSSDPFLAPPLQPLSSSAAAGRSDATKRNPDFEALERKTYALQELDSFGKNLLEKSKPTAQVIAPPQPAPVKLTLNQLKATTTPANGTVGAATALAVPGASQEVAALTNIFVNLESIQPGPLPSLTIYEKNKMKMVLHFGKDTPRPDILVMVLSIMSFNASSVKNLTFQAAVPKSMKIKLQPASATELPAYNPILPPTAVTQVMLLANPSKEKVKLKFKISYVLDGAAITDTGDVLNFPDS